MITHGNEIKIFAGNSNRPLAEAIAKKLNTELGGAEVGRFSDGETAVHIDETVRGRDLFIIQSTSAPVNDNLMELLILIDAARRASAGRITAVIPYFGYARQDRKARSRDPITAKLVADLITAAGADRVLTMDLHAAQIQGFFNIPLDHLLGGPTLYNYFKSKKIIDEDFVVVSPDIGSVTRARNVAMKLNCQMAIIDKRRPKANVMEVMNIIGDHHLPGRDGAHGARCKGSVRGLHARGVQRPRDGAVGKISHQGTGHPQHHRPASRKEIGQDHRHLGGGYFRRGNRKRIPRQADVEDLRLIGSQIFF